MDTSSLKVVFKAVSDGLALLSDVSGGFKFSEIGETIALGNDVQAIFAHPGNIVPVWESLDDAGRAELIAICKASVKFPKNTAVEVYAQKVLDVAVALSAAYQAWNA